MKIGILALVLFVLAAPSIYGQKLKAEEIVAKHLASIASEEKRVALKTLIASSEVGVEFVTQKNQPAAGRLVVASAGPKLFYGMLLNAGDYPQEKIIFDGAKSDVAMIRAGSRSVLGNFIQSNSTIVTQGLLSGTLASSWVLHSSAVNGGKLSTSGTKKIDGKETYVLSYTPKGGSDLDIKMYFDQQTFRHVRTEYARTSSAAMGRTIDESARQSETRIKLIEDFAEHKEFEGMTFPTKYKLSYTSSGQNGTLEIVWTATFSEFAANQNLDPATFSTGK